MITRMLPQFYQPLEKLVVVGQVEVAGHNKVLAHPVALANKRVTKIQSALTVRSIAKMSQQQFTDKWSNGHKLRMFLAIGIDKAAVADVVVYFSENFSNAVAARGTMPEDEGDAGLRVEFERSCARAVLAAV